VIFLTGTVSLRFNNCTTPSAIRERRLSVAGYVAEPARYRERF